MTSAEYKIRTVIILTLLFFWAAGAAVKVYIYSVRDRQALLKRSSPIAWRLAEIPARRGRILTRDGVVLAEDIYCCDLILRSLPESNRRGKNLRDKLKENRVYSELPETAAALPVALRKNLTAEEIEKFTQVFRVYPEIQTAGRLERRYSDDPAVRKMLGEIARNNRQERVGTSGVEQDYDLELSGHNGRIRVMLDRNGSWIYETLEVIRQPENGRDVRLSRTLAELKNNEERSGNGKQRNMAGN